MLMDYFNLRYGKQALDPIAKVLVGLVLPAECNQGFRRVGPHGASFDLIGSENDDVSYIFHVFWVPMMVDDQLPVLPGTSGP